MAAMQKRRYAREFDRLGARIQTYDDHLWKLEDPAILIAHPPEDFPRLVVPSWSEQEFARLVVAAMLGDGNEAKRAETGGRTSRGSASYDRKAFNAAVRLLTAGEAPAAVARQTGIHRNRVARIRDRYVFPRPGSPEYEAVRGRDRSTVVLRRRI